MRIIHVAESLHPDAGGPPAVAISLGAAQVGYGHAVSVIGHTTVGQQHLSSEMFDSLAANSALERHLIARRGHWNHLLGRKFRPAFKKLLSQADIVVVHGIWDPSIVHACRMAAQAGVPYVVRPAGMLDPWSLSQKHLKKMLSVRLLYGKILKSAAFIHATSRYEAANIERFMGKLGFSVPVHIIPNGISQNEIDFPHSPGGTYAHYPQLRGKPYVVFLGRLHHKKRSDVLLNAFAGLATRFPELQLVVAGPDFGEKTNIENQAKQLGIADRVHLTGAVYGEKKFQLLADAACFCLPSEQENFGLAVAEAMAAGTPVVVSDQVQIWPEIEQAGAGIATPINETAVADAIATILSDPAQAARMGAAGKSLVESVFLWPNIAKASIDHYKQVLRLPGSLTVLETALA